MKINKLHGIFLINRFFIPKIQSIEQHCIRTIGNTSITKWNTVLTAIVIIVYIVNIVLILIPLYTEIRDKHLKFKLSLFVLQSISNTSNDKFQQDIVFKDNNFDQ